MPFQGSGADQITGKVGAKASTPSRIAIPDARKRALVTVASHVSVRCVAILSGLTKQNAQRKAFGRLFVETPRIGVTIQFFYCWGCFGN